MNYKSCIEPHSCRVLDGPQIELDWMGLVARLCFSLSFLLVCVRSRDLGGHDYSILAARSAWQMTTNVTCTVSPST